MNALNKPIMAADRTRNIKYAIRDIVVLADELRKKGKELLPLNIGDPIKFDHMTPSHILEAVHQGMLAGDIIYGPSNGIAQAVEAVNKEAKRIGIENIIQSYVTSGASEGIELALTALVNPGENVLLPSPGYPLYPAVLSKIGAEVNSYFLDEENQWQPDVADMEAKINSKTKAICIINPNNPTGSIANEDTIRQVVEVARKHSLIILSDEIYDKILFEGETHTPTAKIAGDHPVITFNGLAKSYLGPGLRMGWAILSGDPDKCADFTDGFSRLFRARLCANTPMQWSIKAALEGDQSHLPVLINKMQKRAKLVMDRINNIEGWSCVQPRGAFYVYPTIEDNGSDWDFCIDLLKKTGVITVPGSGFGQKPGTKHLRIVLAPPEDVLSRAMDQIEEFAKARRLK